MQKNYQHLIDYQQRKVLGRYKEELVKLIINTNKTKTKQKIKIIII